ncbi:5-demethoxyubiquinone hydroxylase, mitochondrial-like [Ctenopharyngodon idella]|uniref:5-demethoxyubiquinone hydroxylase, mitochondrial-like n=1 Tax=Ctenopharyngodon idella TaxID=7959 RepID=UPI00222E61A8|nr:5-demethoxyubiquinone hydroxylase, mitochondrial-like [Ctenopharyngodon idella]
MWDREAAPEILGENRVRPTLLLPLWNIAKALSGVTLNITDDWKSLHGKSLVKRCGNRKNGTGATFVLSISEHYNSQIRTLMEKDPEKYTELLQIIKEFQDDEMKHNDTGLEHDAESVSLNNAI